MSAIILDGNELAKPMRVEIERDAAAFEARHGIPPTLAIVRAGEDPASISYGKTLEKSFASRGLGVRLHALPGTASQQEIVDLVARLNADPAVHGIMIQEPLPGGITESVVAEALSPDKDVDGVHPVNAGRLLQAEPMGNSGTVSPFFVPATPLGGLEILKGYEVDLPGKHAVVVGRSAIVGKPMALLLLRENATVTICHSRTADLPAVCRTADVLCVAVGRAKMIKGGWLKPGAVVIDFGVNFVGGKICGDVDFVEASEVAGMITSVPGGTGPVTNVMSMRNLIGAARKQAD